VWSWDTANVLHHVHQNNIRHVDLSGRNLLLDSERTIRLCDFAGSFIDGDAATIWAESGFRHPDESEYKEPTIKAELHTLGSTIYEIVTCSKPYRGLEDWEMDRLLEERKYPDVSKLAIGQVVRKCWNGEFNSAAEVADEIKCSGMFSYLQTRRVKESVSNSNLYPASQYLNGSLLGTE
jgi:serine/threonine protein kinase